jgi:hypothetical protein
MGLFSVKPNKNSVVSKRCRYKLEQVHGNTACDGESCPDWNHKTNCCRNEISFKVPRDTIEDPEKYWSNECKYLDCYKGDECELLFCPSCGNIFSVEGDIGYALYKVPQPTDPAETPFNACPVCEENTLYSLCIDNDWCPEGKPMNCRKEHMS